MYKMTTRYFSILVVLIIYAESQTAPYLRRCRLCHRATTLSDCTKLAYCDATIEDCFMDELITTNLSVVYEAGCRSKEICNQGIPVGKRQTGNDLVACSRCCNFQDDCNKRLCGIKDDALNSTQCYSCNRQGSGQNEVKDPRNCVTLTECAPNEICYASETDSGGVSEFFYGCHSLSACKLLMEKAFEHYRVCVFNETMPPVELTWLQYCGTGGRHRRSTDVCDVCCADGGCNYGTCEELKARMFTLARIGKLDLNTLRAIY